MSNSSVTLYCAIALASRELMKSSIWYSCAVVRCLIWRTVRVLGQSWAWNALIMLHVWKAYTPWVVKSFTNAFPNGFSLTVKFNSASHHAAGAITEAYSTFYNLTKVCEHLAQALRECLWTSLFENEGKSLHAWRKHINNVIKHSTYLYG